MSNSTETYSEAYLDAYIGYRLKDVAISFMVLDTLFVALRFYSRYIQRRRLRSDDYLMIPALVFSYGTQIIAFIAVDDGGVGRHVQYTSQHYDTFRVWYQTCMIAAAVVYMFAAMFPKLAILALFLQIFVDKPSRYATYATMGAMVINVIVMVPILVYKCDPISYGWKSQLDPGLQGGWCANVEPRLQFASLANIITDVVMLFLPIPTLYKLKTNRTTKTGLILTFGMAIAGLVTSCLRFASFFETQAYTDGTWNSVQLVAWCIVEPGIYIFVASQMAYRPLIMAFLRTDFGQKLFGTFAGPISKWKSANEKTARHDDDEQALHHHPEVPVGQSMHETTVDFDVAALPCAPPSVYNGNIWIRHDYQVENRPRPGSETLPENYT